MSTQFKLSTKLYDEKEAAAIDRLSNRVIQTFGAAHFSGVGYPTRVAQDSSLFRYMDVMQETRFERDFLGIIGGGLTPEEHGLIREVLAITASYSRGRFGRTIVPRGALLRAVNVLRHIEHAYGSERPCVFEIGPGSGYLGLLLQLKGYPYVGTDIAQGFYLHQSNLWEHAHGTNLTELALADPDYSFDFKGVRPFAPVHVPWWHLPDMLLSNRHVHPSVVTCNHAFAEMHTFALAFYVALLFKVLQGAEHTPSVIFEHLGAGPIPYPKVFLRFLERGFRLCMNDEKITAYVPDWDGENAKDALDVGNFYSLLESRGYGRDALANETHLFPTIHMSQNPLCARILAGRQATAERATVDLPTLVKDYQEITGIKRYFSDDEIFLLAIDCYV